MWSLLSPDGSVYILGYQGSVTTFKHPSLSAGSCVSVSGTLLERMLTSVRNHVDMCALV
jgi:hypothetical protein